MIEFTLDTPMKEVEARFPFSRSLLHAKFHVGGCATCGYEPQETVAEVASKHAKDAVAMVEALNEGLADLHTCEISPSELKAVLDSPLKEGVLLVDVREPWEFELVQLPGSALLNERNMEEVFGRAREATEVILVCHHGLRSLNATLFFRQNGIARARSLRGGVDSYAREVDTSMPRY
jgi:rhodanese-related sulfurtransferase